MSASSDGLVNPFKGGQRNYLAKVNEKARELSKNLSSNFAGAENASDSDYSEGEEENSKEKCEADAAAEAALLVEYLKRGYKQKGKEPMSAAMKKVARKHNRRKKGEPLKTLKLTVDKMAKGTYFASCCKENCPNDFVQAVPAEYCVATKDFPQGMPILKTHKNDEGEDVYEIDSAMDYRVDPPKLPHIRQPKKFRSAHWHNNTKKHIMVCNHWDNKSQHIPTMFKHVKTNPDFDDARVMEPGERDGTMRLANGRKIYNKHTKRRREDEKALLICLVKEHNYFTKERQSAPPFGFSHAHSIGRIDIDSIFPRAKQNKS